MSPRRLALLVASGVVLVDQLAKAWALAGLGDRPIVLIDGFLSLALVRNSGAAFGMLRGAGSVIALVAIAAAVLILITLRRLGRTADAVALGLVLGGAVGNLADRLFRGGGLLDGEVIDFVDFSFFPAFNVADAAITIGAMLALWEALRAPTKTSSSPMS